MKLTRYIVLFALCAICIPFSYADEGMWLFNNPPYKTLQDKYHFQPTAAWLEHLQKSSVRFNSGGSGSFVSADGLVMTNHHVGADCLQKISTLVGIIFDGKLQSLVLDYIYTDQEARAVAVHSAGILEALRKVYAADRLVGELTGKK
jgi:S1-C subfamily serine protease